MDSLSSLLTCENHLFPQSVEFVFSNVQKHLYEHYDPRLLFDIGPQISNSLIMLGMAYERYILVCFGTDAKAILSRAKRLVLYICIVAAIAFFWTLFIVEFLKPYFFSDKIHNYKPYGQYAQPKVRLYLRPSFKKTVVLKLFFFNFQLLQQFCGLVNPVSPRWYPSWSFICTRRIIRTISAAIFILVLVINAILYAKIVLKLKKGETKSRKKILTLAFICLWVSWFVQTTPFVIFDF